MSDTAMIVVQSALLFLLVACSAFFSGSETALFSLSRARLLSYKDDPSPVRQLIARMMDSYHSTLTTLILGNMFVNSGISMLDEEVTGRLNLGEPGTTIVSLFTSIVILLICGEVTPKNIAILNPEGVSQLVARPIWLLQIVMSPLIRAVEAVCDTVLDMLGRRRSKALSPEEYKSYLLMSAESGVFSSREAALLSEALALREMKVESLMQARVGLRFVNPNDTPESVAAAIRSARQRFLPVTKGDGDDAEHILCSKDFLLLPPEGRPSWSRSSAIRPAVFIPQSSSITKALATMRRASTDAALTTDEYGGVSGMLSIDSIYRQMLGELQDSSQGSQTKPPARIGAHSWSLDASSQMELVEEMTGWRAPHGFSSSTLNGLLQELLGRIPCAGDKVEIKGLSIKVEKASSMKAERLSVSFNPTGTGDYPLPPHEREKDGQ